VRNTYLLINYGDFVNGGTSTAAPFVQLLSTTNDTAAAHQDFVQMRLSGKDTNNGNPLSSETRPNIRKIALIAGAVGVGLLFLLIGLCICCSRNRSIRKTTTTGGVMGFGGPTYQPLHDPAPNAAYETHTLPNLGYNGGQAPPAYGGYPQPHPPMGGYQTAWDHRYN
jgi:hypothetical protein